MCDEYRRVPIYDKREKRRKRAMDLIFVDGVLVELEMKGQGTWSVRYRDLQEQVIEALKEQNTGK